MAANFESRAPSLSRREWFLALSSLLPAVTRAADDTRFSADVKVVNVLVTVRDKQGKIVRNLTKDDFTLTEDDRPQTIRYFSQQSDIPLTLGLLVDTSMSQRRLIDTERDASNRFFDQVLREDKDMAFVIHFDREVELLQDLTASRKLLQKALDDLKTPSGGQRGGGQRRNPQGGGYPGRGGGYPGGGRGRGGGVGTALYDSVLLASDELMKKQSGRKADILLTDGVDAGSKVSISTAIEAAQRADTLLYSVRFYDESAYGGVNGRPGGYGRHGGGRRPQQSNRPDGKKVLERLSKETGGGYFEVSKKHSIEDIYRQIEEELRNQYSIGYTSDKPGGSGEFRKIALTLKPKGLTVRSRDGYYAGA